MDVLKKRSVAIILSALIVLGSTAATVSSKLEKKSSEISSLFYTGVKYDGYAHKSISSQLNQITASADGLVTIAGSYGIDTSAVTSASRNLKSALGETEDDFGDIYDLYDELILAVNDMKYALESSELSERDTSGLEQYSGTIEGARSVIAASGYNEKVRDYSNSLRGFPSSLFIRLLDIDMPETFA